MAGVVNWIQAHPIVRTIVYGAGCAVVSYLTNTPNLFPYEAAVVVMVNTFDNELAPSVAQVKAVVASQSVVPETSITVTSTPIKLPPLPAGFNLASAKANGFSVYEDATGDVVLSSPNTNWKGETITTWQEVDGTVIPSAPNLTGFTKL